MKLFYFALLNVLLLNLFSLPVSAKSKEKIRLLDGTKTSAQQITDKVSQIVKTQQIAGLSVVIINDNQIVYRNFFGSRNKENNAALDDQTVMYAASLTKPLFAYAFLKLVEKNVFDLDKPVYTYLKKPIGEYEKWKDLGSEKDFQKITARMLLSHSAGLPVLRQLNKDKVTIIAPLQTKFYYSNEGMNLLGFVVEEHTGKKLEDLIAETVFAPLAMKRSGMIWQTDFENNYALGYDRQGGLIGAQKRSSARAAGSMVTTAHDYAQFLISMMKKQGLSKKSFKEMLKPQMEVQSERGFGPLREKFSGKYKNLSWGLGWGLVQTSHGQAFLHGGHTDGWQNYCIAFPEKKTAVILMSNSDNFEPVADKILKQTIGDTESPLEWMGYFDRQN